jgi:hypothetical protein
MVREADQKEDADENYVKRKVDSMCGCPKKEKIMFYKKYEKEKGGEKEKEDETECTFGRFLF